MKIKKENVAKTYNLLRQFGIPVYENLDMRVESKQTFKVPKVVAIYIENNQVLNHIKQVQSKKYSNTKYTLEETGGYYYLTREILPEKSLSTIVLSADQIASIKNISKPTVSELVSLGDRLNDKGTFGL